MSFANGLQMGMGMVRSHYDRQDRKAQQEKKDARIAEMDARNEQRYQDGIKYRDKQAEQAAARHQENIDYRNSRDAAADERWNKQFGLQQSQHAQSLANDKRNAQLVDLQIEQYREAKANNAAVKVLQRWEAGQVPDEKGFETLRAAGLDPDLLSDPELDSSISVAEGVFTGQISPNAPEALSAINRVFQTELNTGVGDKGSNGGVIQSKRVTSIALGDGKKVPSDHVMFELEVVTDKGSYLAPLTVGRSAGADDKVRAVPIDLLARHFRGLQSLRNDPAMQNIYASLGHKVDKKKTDDGQWSKLSDFALYHSKTGEVKSVDGKPVELSEVDKEALKNLRSQYTALSRNAMPGEPESEARLLEIEQQMKDILSQSKSPSPSGNQFTESQSAGIQAVLGANPGWDENKAVAYLKHRNLW